MHFEWDEEKNQQLKTNRGVCFEDVLVAISEERLLDVLPHHNPVKYSNQMLFVVLIRGYVYYVPFVEDQEMIFLKNIIPSRKYQKKYLVGVNHDS
ncbi:MAG: toxin [Gammaproteobacteria bacterium]